jgi:hypothetical protein
VELNSDDYAVTVALFRVCNQRSEEGLVEIRKLLAESRTEGRALDASAKAIDRIITDAEANRWERASKAVRKLMNDQVDR